MCSARAHAMHAGVQGLRRTLLVTLSMGNKQLLPSLLAVTLLCKDGNSYQCWEITTYMMLDCM